MPSRPIAFARSVIMVFLHALHTLFARWEDHVAVFSCFIAWLIPPWLVARLMSWTCMAIGIITIGAAVPVMSYVTYERTMTDVDTNDFGQKAKGSLDYALGLAAASAMVAAVFAIISGACECIPPIPVLWCAPAAARPPHHPTMAEGRARASSRYPHRCGSLTLRLGAGVSI
mmetsp:Transcript_3887/g.12044  ORF Transcript_3887/g.12044 Transcript_3887/m.12044 type:complete len:172 (-) Transcript_3887:1645-2160(-)